MATVQSPLQLKEYAYRKLGFPKVEIQVDDTQAYDRIDEAIKLFHERHYDGTVEVFVPINFTAADEANEYITLPDDIIDVAKIYEGSRYSAEAMSDVKYRIMMDEVFDATNVNMQSYEMTMQHMELISSYFSLDRLFTFNNLTHRLYPTTGKIIGPSCNVKGICSDVAFDTDATCTAGAGTWTAYDTEAKCTTASARWFEGNSILVRAFRIVNPDTSTAYAVDLYNDDFIKKYATALIKQQWGANMKPFDGMPLPGGITVNGQQIWDEATEEIEKLEEKILEDELPVDFAVG